MGAAEADALFSCGQGRRLLDSHTGTRDAVQALSSDSKQSLSADSTNFCTFIPVRITDVRCYVTLYGFKNLGS